MDTLFDNTSWEKQISIIIKSLLKIATNSAVKSESSELDHYIRNLESALKKNEPSILEKALLNLYIRLHSAGSAYSLQEREILTRRKGYSCYPGGLSPLIKAAQFITPDSIVADLGAGNGLQGLLLQCLCPHKKTIQIELSSEMIRVGQIFQQALGIGADRVEWIRDDIVNVPIEAADFIYMYLPAKPLAGGEEVYKAIACKVNKIKRPLVIFSVADCLAKLIDKQFSISYTDGHLTCFVNEQSVTNDSIRYIG
jgi:hypothetical protein